jgi:hypothetical protein
MICSDFIENQILPVHISKTKLSNKSAAIVKLILSMLLFAAFGILFLVDSNSLFNSVRIFFALFMLNFFLQWWLYRRISELEDDAENSNWLRIPAKVLLLLIPAFYIFGTLTLLFMLAMYILGRLLGG